MAPDREFSVSYALTGYQPQTVAVQLARPEGDPDGELRLAPNPVSVELLAAKPVRRAPAKKPAAGAKPTAAKPAAARPAAASPASAASPWPPVR
jgi:hypothetical protein